MRRAIRAAESTGQGSPSPARSMAAEVVREQVAQDWVQGPPSPAAWPTDDTCDAYTSLANSSLLRRRPRVVSRTRG
jgi:hypothetical protein